MRPLLRTFLALSLLTLTGTVVQARQHNTSKQTAEQQAIEAVALQYINGVYGHNAATVNEVLSPTFVAGIQGGVPALMRIFAANEPGNNGFLGSRRITILDRFGDAAAVRADLSHLVSYLQLIRRDGQWQICALAIAVRPSLENQVLLAGPLLDLQQSGNRQPIRAN